MNRLGKWLISATLILYCGIVCAQQPVLYFNRLSHANGLSNDKVNCILQDNRGFTWIGTDDGLNRYDGNNFVVFKNIPGDASTISGNTVTDLHEDKDGILWIATADGGISRYDHRLPPEKKFRQYKHQPGDTTSIPVNIINALQEDASGSLWLATSGAAVIRFDKKRERFFRPPELGRLTINDITFDRDGKIWAGREGGSILKVDPQTLNWQADTRYSNLYASLPHVVVTRLFRDSRQNIWFGSWDKAIYRQHAETGKEESFSFRENDPHSFGLDEAIAFNEDKQGRIWIGGKHFGLYIYDPVQNRFYNYRHDPRREGTLSDNRVNCIFIDPSGLVWLGTNKGISIFNARQQLFVQQFLPDANSEKPLVIYDFFREPRGNLWIGTSNGLYIQDNNGNYQHRRLSYDGHRLAITKIFHDSDGKYYLGTDYTLFSYDAASGKLETLPNTDKDQVMSRLIESRIVSIQKDQVDGNPVIWTAPYGHFFTYYDLKEQRWFSRRDSTRRILSRYSIDDNLIRKIVKTRDGNIWFANAKKGLILVNKNTRGNTTYINNPSHANSLSNNNVYDIQEDRDGNLWISTYGGGLNFLDRKRNTFQHYSSINNLLEGMATDRSGNIWMISNGGLQKFNTRTRAFSYYELPDVEKTGGVKGYIYRDGDGRLYVAGAGYYVMFDPSQVGVQNPQPDVYLTDLSIFNKSYSHLLAKKQVTLQYNQNFFTIHFAL